MKYKLIILCIVAVNILGCKSKTIVSDNNVQTIDLQYVTDDKPSANLISNQDTIRQIINKLNQAQREPAVFKAIFTLRIIYRNGKNQLIICNGSRMKVDGITYKLTQPINKIW